MCVLVLYAAAAPFVIVAHTTNMWIAVAITFAAVQSHIMLNEVRNDLHCTESTLELLLPTALSTDGHTKSYSYSQGWVSRSLCNWYKCASFAESITCAQAFRSRLDMGCNV